MEDSAVLSVTRQGLLSLKLDGEIMYSRRLGPGKRENAAWLQAAHDRSVLVISGDNLDITGSGLDVTAAARLGTLVAGRIRVAT